MGGEGYEESIVIWCNRRILCHDQLKYPKLHAQKGGAYHVISPELPAKTKRPTVAPRHNMFGRAEHSTDERSAMAQPLGRKKFAQIG